MTVSDVTNTSTRQYTATVKAPQIGLWDSDGTWNVPNGIIKPNKNK